jgi:ABC-2 type transport system ATP-binding protein
MDALAPAVTVTADMIKLDNLSLEIRRGEVFGLLGPNGAGKTTTVNVAVGLLKPDSGAVGLDGEGSPEDPRVRRKIGVAPQEMAIYEDLTGKENVFFFGRLQGLSGQELADRAAWSLDFVGLTDRRRDRAKTYSGGMQRRLNLAVAIVHDPALLLLDEPTVGVDPQSRNAIFERIEALQARGRTIVYTTHYMEEAQRLCDRVCIIDRGRVLALDTVDALISAHGGKSVVRARTPQGETRVETDDPVAELKRLQEASGLEHLSVDRPDLEQVFLNLTGRHLRD